LSSVGLTETF